MDTRNLTLRRLLSLAIAAGVLLFVVMAISVQTTLAVDNEEDKDGDKPEIPRGEVRGA